MTRKSELYDVAVIGAGPAGATAALKAAKQGHRVLLVDASELPRPALCGGWLSARVQALLADIGLTTRKVGARAIASVTLYNADLSQSARPTFAGAPGFLVDRPRFDHELVKAAVKAGATFRGRRRVADVVLDEDSVSLSMSDGRSIRSRLLILAAGGGTLLLNRLGLDTRSAVAGAWAAQASSDTSDRRGPPVMSVVFGVDPAGGFGVVIMSKERVWVGVHTTGERDGVIPSLTALCARLVERRILDADLSAAAAAAEVVARPAATALAMDTHVAKHTLIVGDAGGFVAAASGEGIYPAMWSASIAGDVVCEALDAPNPQDILREFDSRWRGPLADYLRAPNTDMQYLLPLIFTNQPMADRMGGAFFAGENI